MAGKSPTAYTMATMRERGFDVAVVERFIQYPKPGYRSDLFGFADLIAISDEKTILIQACAGSSHSARLKKILAEPRVRLWLAHEDREVQLWSWRKIKVSKRGTRSTMQPRVEEFWIDTVTKELKHEEAPYAADPIVGQ